MRKINIIKVIGINVIKVITQVIGLLSNSIATQVTEKTEDDYGTSGYNTNYH